jgi:hypothetical protein
MNYSKQMGVIYNRALDSQHDIHATHFSFGAGSSGWNHAFSQHTLGTIHLVYVQGTQHARTRCWLPSAFGDPAGDGDDPTGVGASAMLPRFDFQEKLRPNWLSLAAGSCPMSR